VIPIALGIGAAIVFAALCAFCAIRPDKVAVYARNRYLHSPKWSQKWPFANMVMKSWYPTYLRWMGVWGFVFLCVWVVIAIREISK